jgi:hypothetical protein
VPSIEIRHSDEIAFLGEREYLPHSLLIYRAAPDDPGLDQIDRICQLSVKQDSAVRLEMPCMGILIE